MPDRAGELPRAAEQHLERHRRAALILMCCGLFLAQLDATVVNVALPSIGRSLAAGISTLQWVVATYTLVVASALLVGGSLGDRYGRRKAVLTGLGLIAVGSLAAGLAPSSTVLVGARAVQALGAALLLPNTLATILETHRDEGGRARALGIWAGVSATALSLGPLVGGALVQMVGWRAVFFVNLPVAVAAFVGVLATQRETVSGRDSTPDLVVLLLSTAFLFSACFALISGSEAGWTAPPVMAALLAAPVAGALLGIWEWRSDHPLLPSHLWCDSAFLTGNGTLFLVYVGGLGVLFLLTLALQDVEHLSPAETGIILAPMFVAVSLLSVLTGRLARRWGPRHLILAGLSVAAAGFAILAIVGVTRDPKLVVIAIILVGAGQGLLTPPSVGTAVANAPAERIGIASAVSSSARQAGGTLGVAVLGAIAGSPARQLSFAHGYRAGAGIAAALYLGCLVANSRGIPAGRTFLRARRVAHR
jgi:MFS transporter, DHA2 family, methylenomycin A resistance protein